MRNDRDDSGSALIIALVLMLALGLLMGALATFAQGALMTKTNLATQRGIELNASNAVTAAMENERKTYDPNVYSSTAPTSTTPNCLPNGALPGNAYYVFCFGTDAPGTLLSRQVQFYACTTSTSCVGTAANQVLYAVADYDDVPPNATPAGFSACNSPTNESTCGIRMTVAVWDLKVNEG